MKRIFLGIPIYEDQVEKFQKELSNLKGLKLVPPENLHFTLKFLGSVEDNQILKIQESLKTIDWGNKFKINIKGIGVFPNQDYIKVIWLGVETDQEIKSLFQKIEDKLGQQFPQDFQFSAHLTLARVRFVEDKEKLLDFIRNKEIKIIETEINKVILYESTLGEAGPEYSVLEEYQLS